MNLLDYPRWPQLARESIHSVPSDVRDRRIRINGHTIDYSDDIDHVVIAGMGGSGVVGDIVLDLALEIQTRVPVIVNKGLRLTITRGRPLVVSISYSGNTVETLRITREALRRGYPVVGVTTGGQLGSLMSSLNVPLVIVPKASAPRFALPAMLYPTLLLLERFGVMRISDELEWGIRGIERALHDPRSSEVAAHLVDGLPVIWVTESRRGIGVRFKNDINENSKRFAVLSIIPEGAHNDVAAVARGEEWLRHVFLGSSVDMEYDYLRIVEGVIARRGKTLRVDLVGEHPLEREMYGVALLGISTIILANMLNTDPVTTEVIDVLKRELGHSL